MRKEHITIFVQQNLYNNSCTLLIPGEIWSKGSNLTSLLLVKFLPQLQRSKTLPRKSRGKMYFHIVTSVFYLLLQKMLKLKGC